MLFVLWWGLGMGQALASDSYVRGSAEFGDTIPRTAGALAKIYASEPVFFRLSGRVNQETTGSYSRDVNAGVGFDWSKNTAAVAAGHYVATTTSRVWYFGPSIDLSLVRNLRVFSAVDAVGFYTFGGTPDWGAEILFQPSLSIGRFTLTGGGSTTVYTDSAGIAADTLWPKYSFLGQVDFELNDDWAVGAFTTYESYFDATSSLRGSAFAEVDLGDTWAIGLTVSTAPAVKLTLTAYW